MRQRLLLYFAITNNLVAYIGFLNVCRFRTELFVAEAPVLLWQLQETGVSLKYTIFITQQCNLACSYCYIGKKQQTISYNTAEKVVDCVYQNTPLDQDIDIGFFGGEPLLAMDTLKQVTDIVYSHSEYDAERVVLHVVSNGTLFSDDIAAYLEEYNIGLGISCDGPPHIQDQHRRFTTGQGSGAIVERNITEALKWFPLMPVNAVFSPKTLEYLPLTLDYLVELGVKNIHLNQDIAASWKEEHAAMLDDILQQIADRYLQYYREGNPRYISLIDSKITVLLRGGYKPEEKCSMGVGELAFGTTGNVYLCERLVGSDDGGAHCIGNVHQGFKPIGCSALLIVSLLNRECQDCSLNTYCMNWCGCTNFSSTKNYNKVNHFTCAAEKAAIKAALRVIAYTSDHDICFPGHLAGTPLLSIMGEVLQ